MTLEELREKFIFYADDSSLADSVVNQLINDAYMQICTERFWHILEKESRTLTVTSGTVSYNLPDDFMYPIPEESVTLYDSSSGNYQTFKVVPFKMRLDYANSSGYVYFDLRQGKLVFTNTIDTQAYAGRTIVFTYIYQPEELSADDDEPVFNKAFHNLLALEASKMFWYNDQQEDGNFDRKMQIEFNILMKKMIKWDANLDYGTESELVPEQWIDLC